MNWKMLAIKASIENNDIAVTDRLTRKLLGLDEDIDDGGPGSGNYGHRGRPGKHGGSLPQGESQAVTKEESKKGFATSAAESFANSELQRMKVGEKFDVRRNKGVVSTFEKTKTGWHVTRKNEKTGKVYEDREMSNEEMANTLFTKSHEERERAKQNKQEETREPEPVNEPEKSEPFDPDDIENELEREDLYEDDPEIPWNMAPLRENQNAEKPKVDGPKLRSYLDHYLSRHSSDKDFAADGGPGSGNFGHSGRPGKVGGSAKGSGGSVFRIGSKESGYSSFVKNELFKGIASHARAAKNDGAFVHAMNKKQQDALMNQWKACGAKESLGTYAERIYNMLHNRKGSDIRQKNKPVNGKDLSETWEYKGPEKKYYETEATKEIDTPIEDILHTQGYDGVPKIVSQAEFDRITKEHPEMPLLYRSYAAPTPEQLKEYDNDLERGFFYVDCGTGGSGFGQGMYCAGVYPHPDENGEDRLKKTLIDGAIEEMKHYRNINIRRIEDSDPHVAPEGKVMVTGGTSEAPLYKYYDPKEFRDFSTPPEDGQLIAYWEDESKSAAETIIKYKDGKIDGTFISWEPQEGDKWAPLEGDCEAVPIDPQATTRVMTLDPSAKIITYKQLAEERSKLRDRREERKSQILREQKKKLSEALAKDILDEAGLSGELRKKGKRLIDIYEFGSSSDDEEYEKIKKELGDKAKYIAREYGRRNNDFELVQPVLPPVPTDYGVLAAMLGYDAINAQGHGQSKSYTVVLNRTKLIISEDEVDVWR